jgi:tetratricopeptide (TPR) repeat protein
MKSWAYRLAVIGTGALATLLCTHAFPADAPEEWVARAATVQGTVEARRVGETQWQPVKLNDAFRPGDTIRVQERSRADLALRDQSVLRLNANTTMTVEAVAESRTWVVDLLRGAAYFLSSGPRRLNVRTAFATAGVRGTEFYVGVEADKAVFTIFEGTVVAQNDTGTLTLVGGQSAVAVAGKAPGLLTVVRPRDAVQWALYYPPVLYFSPEELAQGTDWRDAVRRSLEQQRSGDLQKAFDAISGVPDTVADPRFFAYRASLLLAVGRVDGAGADIGRALSLAPNDANALALQAIIALVQGDNDKALTSAQSAVQAAPNSATANIALSYARQARFDLDGARVVLQTAVLLEPKNALAWARLAELHSSVGELDRSLEAAQKAVELEPNLSRTQTILGYAYLTQVKTGPARAAFEKALALDQADPLPRLGLGLAKIREGDLSGGTTDMEIASLDPNNALVRSYMGKAYFEQKREGLDEREFRVAKELDPKDPTPWFYDAIRKQTANQPVEALQDVEKAIELNDNRAVYRSRLLLDSDVAARSASLGRIYSDLGFQGLALSEGWKSVNIDPTNFSAHRLLADSYSVLPRHEIARVSELLQSQLLQPSNLTPIQPRLAEGSLGLIAAAGPGALSFNEFNRLFTSDGLSVQASGLAGGNKTLAGEAVVAGLYGMTSFSVGYTDFKTDGWRENALQNDRIGNAFLQLELSPQTSVQAEFRKRDRKLGDPELKFFFEDVDPNLKQTEERSTYRLGLRHALEPNSIVLGSFIYQRSKVFLRDNDANFTQNDQEFPGIRSTGGELQHIYRSGWVNLTSGIGSVGTKATETAIVGFFPPFDIFNQSIQSEEGSKSSNAYVYANFNAAKDLTITVGASYDKFEPDNTLNNQKRDQVNPKLGVTWSPVAGTTLRAAAFRVLTRSLISDQTLEPTQVAGFNQFYNDAGATDSRRYGVAVDQKFSRTVFGGIELSRRDLSVPFRFVDFDPNTGAVIADEVRRADAEENLGRAYLFWTPRAWVALSAEYQRERFVNDENVAFSFRNVQTERLPLGVKFFDPSGLSFSLRGTYIKQHGEFVHSTVPTLTGCCEAGSDNFFLVDASLSYRLPKRNGFITAGVTNLTDRHFRYQETDLSNASIQPVRMGFARVTLAF